MQSPSASHFRLDIVVSLPVPRPYSDRDNGIANRSVDARLYVSNSRSSLYITNGQFWGITSSQSIFLHAVWFAFELPMGPRKSTRAARTLTVARTRTIAILW